jgi:hypothetical protein
MENPLTRRIVRFHAPDLAPAGSGAGRWHVRVLVVDATMADVTSPMVASVSRVLDTVDGSEMTIDIPPIPQGARWELQVHARPVAAGAPPAKHPQVRIGDAVTMLALPVADGQERLDAPVRLVTS